MGGVVGFVMYSFLVGWRKHVRGSCKPAGWGGFGRGLRADACDLLRLVSGAAQEEEGVECVGVMERCRELGSERVGVSHLFRVR